jgi:predicted RecB family nuclease
MEDKEPVEILQEIPGIGPTTARKLVEAGYGSIEAIAGAIPAELEEAAGIRRGIGEKVIEAAGEMTKELIAVEAVKVEEEEKEQGPMLDLVDKFIDKESNFSVNIDDIGAEFLGRKLRITGKMMVDLGTLKKVR